MNFTRQEQNELIENYCECDSGLICVNGDELQEGVEYYMDKDECIHMIQESFSYNDSVIHLTDNTYSTQYIEIYNKNDGYWSNGCYDINESNIYYIICPPKAGKKIKEWFQELIKLFVKTTY